MATFTEDTMTARETKSHADLPAAKPIASGGTWPDGDPQAAEIAARHRRQAEAFGTALEPVKPQTPREIIEAHLATKTPEQRARVTLADDAGCLRIEVGDMKLWHLRSTTTDAEACEFIDRALAKPAPQETPGVSIVNARKTPDVRVAPSGGDIGATVAPRKYMPWSEAGGPDECKHGYAAGIPCPRCDATVARPAVGTTHPFRVAEADMWDHPEARWRWLTPIPFRVASGGLQVLNFYERTWCSADIGETTAAREWTRLPDDQPSRALTGRCLFCDRAACLCDTATPDDQPSDAVTRAPEAIEAERLIGGDDVERLYLHHAHRSIAPVPHDDMLHSTLVDLAAARETIAELEAARYREPVRIMAERDECRAECDELRAQLKWRDKTIANKQADIDDLRAQLATVTRERDALEEDRDRYRGALCDIVATSSAATRKAAAVLNPDIAHGPRGSK